MKRMLTLERISVLLAGLLGWSLNLAAQDLDSLLRGGTTAIRRCSGWMIEPLKRQIGGLW